MLLPPELDNISQRQRVPRASGRGAGALVTHLRCSSTAPAQRGWSRKKDGLRWAQLNAPATRAARARQALVSETTEKTDESQLRGCSALDENVCSLTHTKIFKKKNIKKNTTLPAASDAY